MESTILIDQLGLPISLNVLLALVTSVVIVIGLCFLFTRHLSVYNPGKLQLTLEWLVDVMRGIIKDTMGDETTSTQVVIALTVFLFIGVSNLVFFLILNGTLFLFMILLDIWFFKKVQQYDSSLV